MIKNLVWSALIGVRSKEFCIKFIVTQKKKSYVKKPDIFPVKIFIPLYALCRMTFCFERDIRNNYISVVVVKSEINIFHYISFVCTDSFLIGPLHVSPTGLALFPRSRPSTLSFVKFPMCLHWKPGWPGYRDENFPIEHSSPVTGTKPSLWERHEYEWELGSGFFLAEPGLNPSPRVT